MNFKEPLISGVLLRRYKRFLADIRLADGQEITAHTANSGSMKGLIKAGNPVFLSYHDNPSRKLKYSWELVKAGRVWVGINTHLPNQLVHEAITAGVISELQDYSEIRREVKYGKNSRIDLLLENGGRRSCYVEVKNVTLVEGKAGLFPDAVTQRGQKHLEELAAMVKQGHRAVMCFVLQRADGEWVGPADEIDPVYGRLLRKVARQGVEVLAYRAKVSPKEIRLTGSVPVKL